jgi:hypothetical protein
LLASKSKRGHHTAWGQFSDSVASGWNVMPNDALSGSQETP